MKNYSLRNRLKTNQSTCSYFSRASIIGILGLVLFVFSCSKESEMEKLNEKKSFINTRSIEELNTSTINKKISKCDYNADLIVFPSPNGPSTQLLQDAIDELEPGGVLVLAESEEYLIDGNIEGKGVSICGNNATFTKVSNKVNDNFDMLVYDGHTDFRILDLNFNGSRSEIDNNNSIALKILNSEGVLIYNCHFKETDFTAFRLEDCINVGILSTSFTNIGPCNSVGSCDGKGWDAISVISRNVTKDILIEDCNFQNIGNNALNAGVAMDADAIQIQSEPAPIQDYDPSNDPMMDGIKVLSCCFENIGHRCMKFQSGNNIVVSNNYANNCSKFIGNILGHNLSNQDILYNYVGNARAFLHLYTGLPDRVADSMSVKHNTYDNLMQKLNFDRFCLKTLNNPIDAATFVLGSTNIAEEDGADMHITNSEFIGNKIYGLSSGQIWSGYQTSSNITFSSNQIDYNVPGGMYAMNIKEPIRWKIEDNHFNSIGGGNDCSLIHLNNVHSAPGGKDTIKHNYFNYNPCGGSFIFQNINDTTNCIQY